MKKAFGWAILALFISGGAFAQKMNLQELIEDTPSLSTFQAALDSVGLTALTAGDSSYTIFAPTNDAFAIWQDSLPDSILAIENRIALLSLISRHISPSNITVGDFQDEQSIRTLQGDTLLIDLKNGIRINQVNVLKTDMEATNGCLYIIDAVLLPSAMRK